jgi:hypothetical protein
MVLLGSEVDRRAEVVSVPVLEWLDISSSLSSSGGDRTRLNRSGSGMKKPKITKEENGLGARMWEPKAPVQSAPTEVIVKTLGEDSCCAGAASSEVAAVSVFR